MSAPPAPNYALDVLLAARAALLDDAAWTAYLAAVIKQRPGKTVLAVQPPAGAVEICPALLDDLAPPQSFPALRLDVLQSDDVQGINHTVSRTAHLIQIRSFTSTTFRSDLVDAQRANLTSALLAAEEQARAVIYLITAALAPGANSIGVYNVQWLGGKERGFAQGPNSTTALITTQTLRVWQTTRSARFNAPPEAP